MDFSNGSKKAFQYATPFARQFGAELILFHVITPYVPVPGMEPAMGTAPIQEGATEDPDEITLRSLAKVFDRALRIKYRHLTN